MRNRIVISSLILAAVSLFLFFFNGIKAADVVSLKGEADSWTAKVEVAKDKAEFYLHPKENNSFAGEVTYSYKINSSSVEIKGQLDPKGHMHDISMFAISKDDVDHATVKVSWDGKTEAFELK